MKAWDPKKAFSIIRELEFMPSVPFQGADHRWPGVCLRCGQPGSPRFDNARRRGGACKYCKSRGASVDTAVAVATMLAVDCLPLVPFSNATTPWKCQCLKCGRTINPRLSTIKQTLAKKKSLNACGHCSASPNRVDLEFVYKTMHAANFVPSVPYINANEPWPGVCTRCGNPGSPTYGNVSRRGGACIYCARQHVDDAVALGTMLARDFQPHSPYPGSNKLAWFGHCLRCGTPGAPTYDTARVSGVCRTCGTYGYKTAEAGWLYLMERPGEQQVGITNEPDVRLRRHAGDGWTLLDIMGPMPGQKALDLENTIKSWIAAQGIVASGTRENWCTGHLEVKSLTELSAALAG